MVINKIPNQIIKKKLVPLNLSKIDSIVLHHMAHETADVKTVERWHVNDNGWDAIGYNYWIGFDGTIYKGRGLNVGAGVASHNNHIISIGFQGDYSETDNMTDAQFNAGIDTIKYLQAVLPNKLKIIGHCDLGNSMCPGTYFPLKEMQSLSYRGLIRDDNEDDDMIYNYIDENMPEWARSTIQKLVDKGYLKGNEHGELGLNDTMLKIFVINDRAGLYDIK